MALVKCEDCGKEISDLSKACIHCGRPLPEHPPRGVEDEGTESRTNRIRALGSQARDTAIGVTSGAKQVIPRWASHLKGVLPQAQELSSKSLKKLIQDRDLEVLLLPTGSTPDNFICRVDLTDTLEALSAGILVRPRLVVWAHRSDIDRDRLAFMLEEQFAGQVAAFRAARVTEHEETAKDGIASAVEVRKDAERLGRTSRKALLAAMLGMALVTNPFVDLILLVVAVTSGAGAFVEALREVEAKVDLSLARSQEKAGSKKGLKSAEAKKRAFRAALKRWKVKVHPHLFTLASDFALLDDVPEPYAEKVEKAGPSVISSLRQGDYWEALPDWYQPLVERRLETWT